MLEKGSGDREVTGMTMERVEENKQEILFILSKKLTVLAEVVGTLTRGAGKIVPRVSIPRPRLFEFCPGIVWPKIWKEEEKGYPRFDYSYVVIWERDFWPLNSPGSREGVAQRICDFCDWQPRRIAHAVRQIDAAIHWARERHAGLLRAAEEIIKQQSKWQEELKTTMAIIKLGEGG